LAWTIDYTQSAKNQIKKLDKAVARRIVEFMNKRVAKQEDPRTLGKALSGPLGSLWRYRVGDYRIMCELQDSAVTVLVVRIRHRREIYR
jgi:mRNA interferase RelE/StbE